MLDITWGDQRSASQRWSTHCKSVPHCLWVGNEIPGRENQAGGPALSQNGHARLKSQPYHPKELASFVTTTIMSYSTKLNCTVPTIPPTLHLAIVFTVGAKGRSDRACNARHHLGGPEVSLPKVVNSLQVCALWLWCTLCPNCEAHQSDVEEDVVEDGLACLESLGKFKQTLHCLPTGKFDDKLKDVSPRPKCQLHFALQCLGWISSPWTKMVCTKPPVAMFETNWRGLSSTPATDGAISSIISSETCATGCNLKRRACPNFPTEIL